MPGPFDDLEPGEPPAITDPATTTPRPASRPEAREPGARRRRRTGEPGVVRVFSRGALRRCPRCGCGDLFESWFKIRSRCRRCGFRLEREEGGFLGAMTINYAATAIAFLVVLIAWLIADLPDVQVLRLTIAAIGLTLVFPLLFWPWSKTIWAAVDYLVYRSDPDYASRDAADRSSGNGGHP